MPPEPICRTPSAAWAEITGTFDWPQEGGCSNVTGCGEGGGCHIDGCTGRIHRQVTYYDCEGNVLKRCYGQAGEFKLCGELCGASIDCDPNHWAESVFASINACAAAEGLPPIPFVPGAPKGFVFSFVGN